MNDLEGSTLDDDDTSSGDDNVFESSAMTVTSLEHVINYRIVL